MPLPTAYGTIPLGGALPEAYIPVDSVPLLGGALESGYGEVSYAVNMTAAASGSNGITVADDDDIDFGTGDFFLHWEGSLPDWTPSAQERLVRKYNGSTAGFVLNVDTNGTLVFFLVAGAGLLSYSSTTPVGLQNSSSAKVTVSIARSSASTAGSVTFYLNGAQLGSPVSIAAAASITASTSTAMAICGGDGTTGTQRTASNTISCIVGNFAPTAAEVLDLCTNGIPASWKWGSQTAVYTSDFSAGVDGLSASNVTAAGNIDGIEGEDNWYRGYPSTTSNVTRTLAFTPSSGPIFARAGLAQWIQLSFKYFVPSGQTNTNGIRFIAINTGDSTASETPAVEVNLNTTGTATSYSAYLKMPSNWNGRLYWQLTKNSSPTFAGVTGGADDLAYIKDIVVKLAGATMALLPDTIPTSSATTWSDTSGNTGGGTLPAAGATKVTIRR